MEPADLRAALHNLMAWQIGVLVNLTQDPCLSSFDLSNHLISSFQHWVQH